MKILEPHQQVLKLKLNQESTTPKPIVKSTNVNNITLALKCQLRYIYRLIIDIYPVINLVRSPEGLYTCPWFLYNPSAVYEVYLQIQVLGLFYFGLGNFLNCYYLRDGIVQGQVCKRVERVLNKNCVRL